MSIKLSKTFMLASFICTLLVICIHYNSLNYYHDANLSNIDFFFQLYLVSGISRVAVPFFALASGFFLFISLKPTANSYIKETLKRIRTIALPYIIVVMIITLFRYTVSMLKNNEQNYLLQISISTILAPDAVQLWYIRDLFFLVLIAPIIQFLCQRLGILAVLTVLVLWILEIQPFPKLDRWYLISIETFCFFTVGCFLSYRISTLETFIKSMGNKTIILVTLVYFGTMLARVVLDSEFDNWYNNSYTTSSLLLHKAGILSGLLFIISICYRMESDLICYFSQFNFFVYLYHVTPISNIIYFFWHQISDDKILFYFTTPSAILICYATAIILKKIAPPIYNLMSGGRSTRS